MCRRGRHDPALAVLDSHLSRRMIDGYEAKEILEWDYQGGPDAFRREAATKLGLTFEEMPPGAPNTRRIRDILNAKKLGWKPETNVTPSQYLSGFDIETDAQRAKADLFSAQDIHGKLRVINEEKGIAARRKIDEATEKFLITSAELVSIAKAVLGQGDPSAPLSDKGHFISQGLPAGIPAGDMLRTDLGSLLRGADVADPLRRGLTGGDDSMVNKAVEDYRSGALTFNAAVRKLTDLGEKPGDIPELLEPEDTAARRRPRQQDTTTTQTRDQQIQSILDLYAVDGEENDARRALLALGLNNNEVARLLRGGDRPPTRRGRGGGDDPSTILGGDTNIGLDGTGGQPQYDPVDPTQRLKEEEIATIKEGMLLPVGNLNHISVNEGIEAFRDIAARYSAPGVDREFVSSLFKDYPGIQNEITSSSAWDDAPGLDPNIVFDAPGRDDDPDAGGDGWLKRLGLLQDPTEKSLGEIFGATGREAEVTDYLSRIFPGMMGGPFGDIISKYRQPLREGFNLSNLLGPVGGTGEESTFENYLDTLKGGVPGTSYGQVAQLASDLMNWRDIGAGQEPAWQDAQRRQLLQNLSKDPQEQFGWWLAQQQQQLPWHMRGQLTDSATRRFEQLLAQSGKDPDWQFLPQVMREGLYPSVSGPTLSNADQFSRRDTGPVGTGLVGTGLESTLTPEALGRNRWPGTYYDEPWEREYK